MKEKELCNWYVIQTRAGNEEKVKEKLEKQKIENLLTLLPKRKLWIRRKGEFFYELKPLFPGYFFIQVEMNPLIVKAIRRVPGVIRILGNKKSPQEVPPEEMKVIFSLMQEQDIIPPSQAFFVNERIKIVGGPLCGMEGKIVSVDKRKKRVKIKLPFFNTYKEVYLSFELIEKT